MTVDVLAVMADAYREGGPWDPQVVVRDFLLTIPRHHVEQQLAALLDDGTVSPGDPGKVRLTLRTRVSLFSRPMLMGWLHTAHRRPPGGHELAALVAIRSELREVCSYCLVAPEEDGLAQRAVEIAAVLATVDLDPRAMDVAAGLPGTARSQVASLTEGAEASCSSIAELQARARRHIASYREAHHRVR
ncbi:hypothetical protein [Kineosporia sp. A_224]|uniref:hypothetical protein n=1 Tax=Kineosporia sp. A_224 TaxID=1962180 RepID=UPI00117BA344|nr:hypothetical protein [Kineosporia sp. A_224]